MKHAKIHLFKGKRENGMEKVHTYLLVMSPSRAEEFSARLGSARDLFHLARKQKLAKNETKIGRK